MEPTEPPTYASCLAENYNKKGREDVPPDNCAVTTILSGFADLGYPDRRQHDGQTATFVTQTRTQSETNLRVADNYPLVLSQQISREPFANRVWQTQLLPQTADNWTPQGDRSATNRKVSFLSHKVLACFVVWFCCIPFGLAAYVLAGKRLSK
jgi:hypothetical protein